MSCDFLDGRFVTLVTALLRRNGERHRQTQEIRAGRLVFVVFGSDLRVAQAGTIESRVACNWLRDARNNAA